MPPITLSSSFTQIKRTQIPSSFCPSPSLRCHLLLSLRHCWTMPPPCSPTHPHMLVLAPPVLWPSLLMFHNRYASAPWTDGGESPAQKWRAIQIDLTLFNAVHACMYMLRYTDITYAQTYRYCYSQSISQSTWALLYVYLFDSPPTCVSMPPPQYPPPPAALRFCKRKMWFWSSVQRAHADTIGWQPYVGSWMSGLFWKKPRKMSALSQKRLAIVGAYTWLPPHAELFTYIWNMYHTYV